MDMNKVFFLRKEDRNPRWHIIDAEGKVLGRLATQVADLLRGKNKPCYTPHTDCGDYVVIINADKVALTGDKWENKTYVRHTMWMGGLKTTVAKDLRAKHPTRIIELAVKRMLPKNKLNRNTIDKLKVYAGSQHPHAAQRPVSL